MLLDGKVINIIKKVQKYITENGLIHAGEKCLVAYSGGMDSVVLLYVLKYLSEANGYSVCAAHYNHKLRGRASDEDALFVKKFCAHLNIECFVGYGDVSDQAQKKKKSIEEMAREMRYDYLNKVAEKVVADVIAVGHHADDQAETFLLQLLRGAGSGGLLAMRPQNGKIVRPLLCLRRWELADVAAIESLPVREDATNEDNYYLRNKVRNDLIPFLREEYNSNIVEVLNRTAKILRDEYDCLQAVVDEHYSKCVSLEKSGCAIVDCEMMMTFSVAVQRGIIRRLYSTIVGTVKNLTFKHVEIIMTAIQNGTPGSEWHLPKGLFLCKRSFPKDYLLCGLREPVRSFLKEEKNSVDDIHQTFSLPVNWDGIIFCQKIGVSVTVEVTENKKQPDTLNDVYFDYDRLRNECSELILRNRWPKDEFSPFGMNGTKKLKKFYIDEKIPQEKRNSILLLASGKNILWVCGYRRSNSYLVSEKTKKVLHLHFSAI